MARLNSCPFCGSDNVDLYSNRYPHPPFKMSWVECHNCGAITTFQENERPEETLVLWNGGRTDTPEEAKAYRNALKRWGMSQKNGRTQ